MKSDPYIAAGGAYFAAGLAQAIAGPVPAWIFFLLSVACSIGAVVVARRS